MYRILNVINNNVALVKNEKNEELMITGSGVAFHKKKGDIVIAGKVDKVFKLNTEESKENFLTLLKDVPLDFITVTYEVIGSLTEKYDYPVQEYLYVTLTDHIYCSYQALRKGTYQKGSLPNFSIDNPLEYTMSREALAVFREKLLDQFPDDEVGRIALHFINAKGESANRGQDSLGKTKEILRLVQDELEHSGIHRTEGNSHFYDRFMIHLSYFLDYIDRNRDDNTSLLQMEEHIKDSYPDAYEMGSRIYDTIAKETGIDLYRSERIYIVLHIQRLL
ncbi:PRD domain-containing protein [Streptococcus panodentis]|uniref:Transcription antiterminator lact n=1 Tax=Streptococcus panodentis TaxID=1581472 RepID=A0ABS5B0D1_9STRE|nr:MULTISPECIES: PRD domain-containing protein [Streptococcus]KXT82568.1 Beta-glucoside bgl operon antiterminator, BglG family [Streptococcus sp. DD11]MBP2622116.1 transcription antiterminator lact [Streptococcus panodentis]